MITESNKILERCETVLNEAEVVIRVIGSDEFLLTERAEINRHFYIAPTAKGRSNNSGSYFTHLRNKTKVGAEVT